MKIDQFKKIIDEEKEIILNTDMKALCLSAQLRESEDVKTEAIIISRSLEYAERIITAIIKNLEGE